MALAGKLFCKRESNRHPGLARSVLAVVGLWMEHPLVMHKKNMLGGALTVLELCARQHQAHFPAFAQSAVRVSRKRVARWRSRLNLQMRAEPRFHL